MNYLIGQDIAWPSSGKMHTQVEGRGKAIKEELDYSIHTT